MSQPNLEDAFPEPTAQVDDLWKILTRLDSIVAAVNSKSSFLVAYNTFIIGTVILKLPDLTVGLKGNTKILATVLLVLLLAASFFSLIFTFRAAYPFLFSPKKPQLYHSLIFFGHIAEHPSPDDLVGLWNTDVQLRRDLLFQIHTISKAALMKSTLTRAAIGLILFLQVPLIAIVALVRVVSLFVITV